MSFIYAARKEAVHLFFSAAGDVISKRRHCTEHSSRVTTYVARADEVLESTQADHNREARSSLMQAASKLAIVLGLYARLDGYFPPYKEWKEQSPHSFNDVMKDIMRDYDFVDDEGLPANREKLGGNYTTIGAYLKAHQTKSGGYPDEYTRAMCEKVEESCAQRELMNSSEPSVLSPILDEVYKGHHGGYERGRGLGCSRAIWCNNMQTDTSNETIQNLTLQLQNAKAEIENSKSVIEALRARDGETQALLATDANIHNGECPETRK
ncbi:hypothetical protein Taro_039903, partial [Colocasia esculenta]|nr:hypothetical protein [Colocasia esculenta]